MRARRGLVIVLAVLAVAVVAAQVVFYFPRTVDDLFISLRYADHFAHGVGLVYNPGEHVEGFSSPLWVLLQSLGFALGVEGVIATKLLSLSSLALLFALAWRYSRRLLLVGPVMAAVVLVALAANSYIMAWALLGLETPLYLALLLAWPLALARHLAWNTRGTAALAVLVGLALCLVRPEAPLYVALMGIAQVLEPRPGRALRLRVRRALVPALALIGVALLLLSARHAYYGLWLPHTYYAKQGHGFDTAKLSQLYGEGASTAELAFLAAGFASGLWLAVWRRHAAPLLAMLACLLFVCAVLPDWMPNQRHVLPVWLFALLSLGAAADAFLRGAARQRWRWVPGLAFAGLVVATAVYQVRIDSRYSKRENRSHGGDWILPKKRDTYRDAWLSIRHVPPPHVAAMRMDGMGMIQQLFHVIEASAQPEADSWYIGRDIGRVGYYSPVRVFDTDGLFTPSVAASGVWQKQRAVTPELIRTAFSHHPVTTQLLDGWPFAAVRLRREIGRDYTPVVGSWRYPEVLVQRTARLPSSKQLLDRYDRVTARFPHSFYLATLYGESVGGAVERRAKYMRGLLAGQQSFKRTAAPAGLVGAGVRFDGGAVRLHGCGLSKPVVKAGGSVTLRCYFSVTRRVTRNFSVFVHLMDESGQHVLSADHAPCAGLYAITRWEPGQIIEDAEPVSVAKKFAGQKLRLYIGLFAGNYRATAGPPDLVDDQNRVLGPTLRVER